MTHDIDFQVPFRHRLRFTDDVFGDDQGVLLDLLEASQERKPRVQFWLDEGVATACPDLEERLQTFLTSHQDKLIPAGNVQTIVGGEAVKNDVHLLERILKVINHADLDRRSYIVAVGGGAVLDAVGFAAAIAHRGIRLVRLPTTTLAQGDSGIGVKNSVNLFHKKNWLGTFAVPWGVVNDAKLLESLSDRDFVAGFSEAVKVALLKDAAFFDLICGQAASLRSRDMRLAHPVIRQSAQWHLKHITAGGDPFEMQEARPLDFGHWSAHKLESMTDFQVRHGEAVAIGVAIDTVYSSLKHGLPRQVADRVLECFSQLGLELFHESLLDTPRLFEGLEEFRQHLGGRLTLTMLAGIGQPIDVHEIDDQAMHRSIGIVAEHARTHAVASAIAGADEKRNEA